VTTISKSQSLTSVSIKDCTLRVPNKTIALIFLRAIIKAIFTSLCRQLKNQPKYWLYALAHKGRNECNAEREGYISFDSLTDSGSFLAEIGKPGTQNPDLMMMIAFITIISGLFPLIEVLCAQIFCFKFEIIGGLRSHLLLFFFERKLVFEKKTVSP